MIGRIGNFTAPARTNNNLAKTGFGRTYVLPNDFEGVNRSLSYWLSVAKDEFAELDAPETSSKNEVLSFVTRALLPFEQKRNEVNALRSKADVIEHYLKHPEDAKADIKTLRKNANVLEGKIKPFKKEFEKIEKDSNALKKAYQHIKKVSTQEDIDINSPKKSNITIN